MRPDVASVRLIRSSGSVWTGYKLSLRELVETIAERGLSLAHTTILHWVKRYTPEFVNSWKRVGTPAGASWRVDETYLKIFGRSVYLYGAADRACQTALSG